MSKICSKCGQEKDSSEFYKTSGARCKVCHNKQCIADVKKNPERNRVASKRWYHKNEANRQRSIDTAKKWQKDNSEADKLRRFRYNMKRNYGLSYENYLEMVEDQAGLCAICQNKPKRNLDIDHCHETNKIRGLLCGNCNTAIGLLKENPELFANAVVYLQKNLTSDSPEKHRNASGFTPLR